MTFGSLFAGIGGMDLGLERAGMECRWQVEIDPFCRKVLTKHWPDVPKYEDVRDVGSELESVDLICGGFPCQDISYAGKGAGLAGERSGLWYEFARILGEVEPRFAIVENVAALLNRGMGDVLGTLADLGYDASWFVLPASSVGAPHRRERIFIVADADSDGGIRETQRCRLEWLRPLREWGEEKHGFGSVSQALRAGRLGDFSGVPRVDDGLPDRVDRLRGLGNAVVPQVAEWIGRRIMEAS